MYPIHRLANIVAMASDREQLALTEDIHNNGQTELAVLWNGELVDGRCRQLACETLGIKLQVRELDSKLSEDEVAKIVKSLNTRRNLTMTQKIASAYKQQLGTKETNSDIAKQWAVSIASLKNFKYIAKHKKEFVEPLFNGSSVIVNDPDKGYEVTTNKVSTLARIVKKGIEAGTVLVDDSEKVEFAADGLIRTELGKDWYYSTVKGRSIDLDIRMYLVELANLKYKEKVE